MNSVVQILDTLADEVVQADRTDGQLLDLFVRLRDEGAFASLVRRYGAMVLGVCRRVLRNSADADDAFQAAFLVLARKAATISTQHLLAPWLYGVAYNTARKLRQSNAKRATRERPLAEAIEPHANAPGSRAELLAILDEELSQLPQRYSAVIVLCDLEGLTRREAAQRLACPEGTVAGRLSRARALLAERLSARGIASAAGLLAMVLAEGSAVAVSPSVAAAVVRAVSVDDLAHATAKGLISPRVADTTEGVLKGMFATKLRTIAAAVLCCGLALACAAGAIHFANAQPAPRSSPNPLDNIKAAPDKPADPAAPATAEKKHLSAIPLKKLVAKPTAAKLSELLPAAVTVAAARDENTLIVYATAKGTEDVRLVLRTLGEELPKEAAKPAESKKYTFQFRDTPWEDVLEWYSKESGLTRVTTVKPRGTVTIVSPQERRYTLAEITDLINEALAQQKLILIRGKLTFFIHPADERIEPSSYHRIELADLKNWGKTELVEASIPLGDLDAEDIKDELRKLLTPYGEVVFAKGKRLVIHDTAGNIARILATLEPASKRSGISPESDLPKLAPKPGAGGAEFVTKRITVTKLKPAEMAAEIKKAFPRVQCNPLPAQKVVVVYGMSDELDRVVKFVSEREEKAKKPVPDSKPSEPNASIIKTYDVPAGTATELAKTIQSKYPLAQIVALDKQNQILVLAPPEVHRELTTPGYGRPGLLSAPLPGLAEKTYSFKFEKASWADVFSWYAKETGLKRIGETVPPGTFTFAPPKYDQTYTLTEMTDIFNDALIAQKWLLIHSAKTFAVVPADEKVDTKFVTHVELDELAKRGRTEFVSVHITLPAAIGPEITDAVRKMTGPFGTAQWYPPANTLMLRDTVENLRAIAKTIRALEGAEMNEWLKKK